MGRKDMIVVGYLNSHIANIVGFPHTGVVYADPGIKIHIQKHHGHELENDILKDPFKYIRKIINSPDFVGSHPKLGGIELIKKFNENLQVAIQLDQGQNYLYAATLHPIYRHKIEKRLNKRIFQYSSPAVSKAHQEAAVTIDTKGKGESKMQNEKVDKTKEIMEQLEKGIRETMDSEKYKAFLQIQSQFHRYSFNNAMLIYLQRPDATRVAGYKKWQELGRNVLKGEKGIGILAPSPYKYEKEVDKIDPKTKKPERDQQGHIIKEKQTVEGLRFMKVTVFDVKQTAGKELPSLCNELQGNSVNAESIIKAIRRISDVPIIEKAIEDGAKGYYSRLEGLIAIKEGMPLDQSAKTHVHEYAHSQLHNTEATALLDRATKEVQAESVAYIVSNHFGLDTSEYSFEYLAAWSGGKELKELKESFDLIQKTANKMIDKMEAVLTKELELQNSPAKIEIIWSESEHLKEGQLLNIHEANEVFKKLDQDQTELRKVNPKIDPRQITAGDNYTYIPYLKTKFELQLSDGRTSQARFYFGDSEYKDLFECIRKECYIDVKQYIKDHETKINNEVIKKEPFNVLQKVIEHYKAEYPAIKHISEKSAQVIDNLNQQNGSILTVKDIKKVYKQAGTLIDQGNDKADIQEFKTLRDVVDDLKQAQLKEKQIQAKENQLDKPKMMEMEIAR